MHINGAKADAIYLDDQSFNEDDVHLTPHEERKQLRLQRKHTVKDRDLDRRQKRQDKRRQFY